MTQDPALPRAPRGVAGGIWAAALGYFLCYAPYSALVKALSSGLLPGMEGGVSGVTLLPSTVLASLVGMVAFLSGMGWWQYAGRVSLGSFSLPAPGRWTLLSGLCTAAILCTTTLAYTFKGASILLMMLLMRGGVLVIAPIVDRITGRKVRWFSWVALALSLSALLLALTRGGGFAVSVGALIDVGIYLAAYFIRLRFMSRLAKSDDPLQTIRYFVEEQIVATPVVILTLGLIALVGWGEVGAALRTGFTTFLSTPAAPAALLAGLFSQGTGVFGGLILLDKRENSFCIPVNRASSILAGLLASASLALWLGEPLPGWPEWVGAALMITAILFLSLPPLLEKRRG